MLPAHSRSHALYHNRTKQHFKPPGTLAKVKAASADKRECSICANGRKNLVGGTFLSFLTLAESASPA